MVYKVNKITEICKYYAWFLCFIFKKINLKPKLCNNDFWCTPAYFLQMPSVSGVKWHCCDRVQSSQISYKKTCVELFTTIFEKKVGCTAVSLTTLCNQLCQLSLRIRSHIPKCFNPCIRGPGEYLMKNRGRKSLVRVPLRVVFFSWPKGPAVFSFFICNFQKGRTVMPL
jgi:hypothetical protein